MIRVRLLDSIKPTPSPAPPTEEAASTAVTKEEVARLEQLVLEQRLESREFIARIQHESHSGPMPSPRQLALYDAVLPGTAQVIRDEFQANSAHVRAVELRVLEFTKDDNDKNRKAAVGLVAAGLIATVLLALAGRDGVATAIAVSTIGAVITGFLKRPAKSKLSSELTSNSKADTNSRQE